MPSRLLDELSRLDLDPTLYRQILDALGDRLGDRLDDDPEPEEPDGPPEEEEPLAGDAGERGMPLVMRLLKTRTIFVARPVTDKLYERVVTQLTILEQLDAHKPITVLVNSPGGSADSGFAIYDAMRFVAPPIYAVCNGICASAGVIIYLGGEKGKRFSLPNSRFLLHQPSTFTRGQASDLEITAREILKLRDQYNRVVAEATGKDIAAITKDADRDFWLDAEEAKKYGLVDAIITSKSDLGLPPPE